MANTQGAVATDGLKALEGVFDTIGQSDAFPLIGGWANVTLWLGTATAFDIQLEKSLGGVWHPIRMMGIQMYRWTAPTAERFQDGETGVRVRLNLLSITGGTLNWRLSR